MSRPAPIGRLAPHRSPAWSASATSRLPPPRSRSSTARARERDARADAGEREPGLLLAVDEAGPCPSSAVLQQRGELVAVRRSRAARSSRSRGPRRRRSAPRRRGAAAPSRPRGRRRRPGPLPCSPRTSPRFRTTRSRSTGVSHPSSATSVTRSWNVVLPRSSTADAAPEPALAQVLGPASARRRGEVARAHGLPVPSIEDPDRPLRRGRRRPRRSRPSARTRVDELLRSRARGRTRTVGRSSRPPTNARGRLDVGALRELGRPLDRRDRASRASGSTVWTHRTNGLDTTRETSRPRNRSTRRSACRRPRRVSGRSWSGPPTGSDRPPWRGART